MGAFQRVYTDDQRAALASAYADAKIRPLRRIVELAREGRLSHEGRECGPFHATTSSVYDLGRRKLREREGTAPTKLEELDGRDAIELLRRRLVSAADAQLAHVEKLQRTADGRERVNPEMLRQIARAVREISALPTRDAPAQTRAPGAKVLGEQRNDGGATRGGLAGRIKASVRARPIERINGPEETAQDETEPPSETSTEESDASAHGESARGAAADTESARINAEESVEPGTYARAAVAELRARSVSVSRPRGA